jgi:predicted TIM-barrel fold metal-dependent hydrolase
MIVDIHTHFFDNALHWGQQVFDDCARCNIDPASWKFTAEDHLRETAAADYAVVFGLRGAKTGWNIPNDVVANHVARAPQRLIFFTSIDPGVPGFMEELEHTHQDLGACGVKISPIYQGVHPHDSRYYEIFDYCQRHGLPILTHMATTFSSGVPLEWARPALMDKVAIDFPEMNIIMAHLGHPWEGEAIAAIRKQRNLFADLSALYYRPWQFYNSMRLAVEYKATGKILLGSDYPATTTSGTITALRNMNDVLGTSGLPDIPSDVIESIINRDSLAMLGITYPDRNRQNVTPNQGKQKA